MVKATHIQRHYPLSVTRLDPLPDSSRARKIESDRGPFVLRLFGADSAAERANEVAVLRFLARRSYPAPRLLAARDGRDLVPFGDRIGYITTFVPGTPASAADAYGLGAVAGRLHALDTRGAGLAATPFTPANERRRFAALDADPAVRSWQGYSEIRDRLSEAWATLSDLDDAPRALIHTDILDENAVLGPDGAVTLIDWDGAGLGPAVQDIGYFLGDHLASPAGEPLPLDAARAFMAGYSAERRLTPLEWDLLPHALTFGAIVYVLAPWDKKIYDGLWRRARYILPRVRELCATLRQGIGDV